MEKRKPLFYHYGKYGALDGLRIQSGGIMVKIKGWICALVCVCLAIACAGCGEPDAAVSSGAEASPTAQYENGFEEYERPEPEGGGEK